MDEHFDALDASEIEEEYWGVRQSLVELRCSPTDAKQAQSDDALTLPDIEMHQDYWGDDEEYILYQYSNEPADSGAVWANFNASNCKCQLCSNSSKKSDSSWPSYGCYDSSVKLLAILNVTDTLLDLMAYSSPTKSTMKSISKLSDQTHTPRENSRT